MNKAQWPTVSLGEVVSLKWRAEAPITGKSYRLVGVRLWGQGVYVRDTIDGSGTKYRQLFRVEEGDIIVNKIWARNGSVSVVTNGIAGAFGSSEFPTYVPDSKRLDPRWAYWFTRSPRLWEQCSALSWGTSGQNRLRPERFLEVRMALPSLAVQKRLIAQLDATADRLAKRVVVKHVVEDYLDAMLAAAFERIVRGVPRSTMGDVAPLRRRPVEIYPEGRYAELGVRSFGRGLFAKPTLTGSELTWQKLFLIKEGDIVFSNIKAWEGAFAVAGKEHDGKVGSHRYLTCVPERTKATAAFLWYFLQSKAGLDQIQAASPGSADRNRTLGQAGLEAITIPLPPLEQQQWFDVVQAKVAAVRARSLEADHELDRLIPAMLDGFF